MEVSIDRQWLGIGSVVLIRGISILLHNINPVAKHETSVIHFTLVYMFTVQYISICLYMVLRSTQYAINKVGCISHILSFSVDIDNRHRASTCIKIDDCCIFRAADVYFISQAAISSRFGMLYQTSGQSNLAAIYIYIVNVFLKPIHLNSEAFGL